MRGGWVNHKLQQSAIPIAFSRICSISENNNDFSNDSIMSIMNYNYNYNYLFFDSEPYQCKGTIKLHKLLKLRKFPSWHILWSVQLPYWQFSTCYMKYLADNTMPKSCLPVQISEFLKKPLQIPVFRSKMEPGPLPLMHHIQASQIHPRHIS